MCMCDTSIRMSEKEDSTTEMKKIREKLEREGRRESAKHTSETTEEL